MTLIARNTPNKFLATTSIDSDYLGANNFQKVRY